MPRVILNAADGGYVGQVDVEGLVDGTMPDILFIDPRTFAHNGTMDVGSDKARYQHTYNEVVAVDIRPDSVDQGPVT